MSNGLLEHLGRRVLFFDGAMGTQLQASHLNASDFDLERIPHRSSAVDSLLQGPPLKSLEGCNELLNLTRPDLIHSIHRAYFEAGSDLVETNSFGTTSIVLADYGLESLVYELAKSAGEIASSAAREASTESEPKFAIGSLGPGTKLISLGQTTWSEVVETYEHAFQGLLDGGVDGFLLETMQDLLFVKAGIYAANQVMRRNHKQIPLLVQVTMEQTGTMLLGSELAAALNSVECFPEVVGFGMNCATGPLEMLPHVRFLSNQSSRMMSIQPNAGLPVMEKGQAVYKLSPDDLAEYHDQFTAEYGAAIVGGCCGTGPEHIRAVRNRIGERGISANSFWAKNRTNQPAADSGGVTPGTLIAPTRTLTGCSSLFTFVPYEQDNSILIIGEKTNANGSKAFREMLSNDNWEGLTELAKEQEAEGSHALDVCVAYVGRNEERDMKEVLFRYNRMLTAPVMIDSTEINVIEAALQTLAGKPIVNSFNFEDGGKRSEAVCSLCRDYGAAVVALTIDETGMAKTADKKLGIARRILETTRSYGLPDSDVFIDCLTFTLGSGDEEFRDAGRETLEAIRRLHQEAPNVNTILGVSNISFGLKPAIRRILNSAFLQRATEVGLTSAIVHFSKLVPESKIDPEIWKLADDLIQDHREFALQG